MKQLFLSHSSCAERTSFSKDVVLSLECWQSALLRKTSLVLLIAYALLLIRPAMPLFADAVAHTFCEQQHMLVVHEVHGKFHVHQEAVKNAGGTEKPKSGTTWKADSADDVFIIPDKVGQAFFCIACANDFPLLNCKYNSFEPCMNYPPPKA